MTPALRAVRPIARQGAGPLEPEDIAVEAAIALEVNGTSQAVMMATPADLDDFALGFALAEGWITRPEELLDLDERQESTGLVLSLRVTAAAEHRLKVRRRTLAGRTGCGLCGIDSLSELEAVQPAPVSAPTLAVDALSQAMAALQRAQVLNQRCGGLHAAAWCDARGQLQLAREDIGRHNALDKLAGALARRQTLAREGLIALSSRASYELVHKTALTGCGVLASVSAPSSLAIDTAARLGVQLWAFVREGRATRYA